MVLNGIRGTEAIQTFNCLIVEIPVGHSDVFRKTILVHRESMIMACDLNLVGLVSLQDGSLHDVRIEFVGFTVQGKARTVPRQIRKSGKPRAAGLLQWRFPLRGSPGRDFIGFICRTTSAGVSQGTMVMLIPNAAINRRMLFDAEIVCHDFQGTPSVSEGQK